MKYTLLRNAAALLEFAGKRMVIDPSLDPAGARPAIANTANQRRNPLVGLPDGWKELIADVDALLITHLHQDHFDSTGATVLRHVEPVYSQPEDVIRLGDAGLSGIVPVRDVVDHHGISITRTPGSHGTGEIGKAMAPVSGFVLESPGEPVVYIAGDTIWYPGVQAIIEDRQPDVIVVNGSSASFLEGDPIVMNANDIAAVHRAAPEAVIIIVHLEAINHCHETRDYYRRALPELSVDMTRIVIPADGESFELSK